MPVAFAGETLEIGFNADFLRDGLESALRHHPGVRALAPDLEKSVLAGELTPALAARQIRDTFLAAPEQAPED